MSAIFGFTFHIGRMTEVLTPDIYRAHCLKCDLFTRAHSIAYARVRIVADKSQRVNVPLQCTTFIVGGRQINTVLSSWIPTSRTK